MSHSIELLSDEQKLIFKSFISNKVIENSKINKIEITPINPFVIFSHDNGKLTLLNSIDGLHELINEIKKSNPNLKTKGC